MNPFVGFLVGVPLVASVLADLVCIYAAIFLNAPTWPLAAVLTPISAALVYLFVRTSRGRYLEYRGASEADPSTREFITNFIVTVVYVTLAGLILMLLKINDLRYWIGGICSLLGFFMLASGLLQIIQVKRDANPTLSGLEYSKRLRLRQYQSVVIPERRKRKWLVVLFLLVAVFAWPAFNFFDLGRFLSVFDLIGLLFLSGTVVFWVISSGVALDQVSAVGNSDRENPLGSL